MPDFYPTMQPGLIGITNSYSSPLQTIVSAYQRIIQAMRLFIELRNVGFPIPQNEAQNFLPGIYSFIDALNIYVENGASQVNFPVPASPEYQWVLDAQSKAMAGMSAANDIIFVYESQYIQPPN